MSFQVADGTRWSRCAWALLVYLWLNSPVAAAEVHLGLDSIDFPSWGAKRMQAMLRWHEDGRIDLEVVAEAVRFTPRLSLSDLALSCVLALGLTRPVA